MGEKIEFELEEVTIKLPKLIMDFLRKHEKRLPEGVVEGYLARATMGLHTFRHWKATMEYHKTRDILHVQQLLGHRDLRNTLVYINLEKAIFQNVDDEFHVKVAHSLDEACKLLEVGYP